MVFEAAVALSFIITMAHIRKAKDHRRDGYWCVVSQAIRATSKDIIAVYVGASVVRITYRNGKVIRYQTPANLREGLRYWDRMGDWMLPPGVYTLKPPPKHQIRKSNPARIAAKISVGVEVSYTRIANTSPRRMVFLSRQRRAA
jgi:hypothetical protein